jgi:hypothetical protein
MRAFSAAAIVFAMALGGCASTPPFPAMRPLTQAHIEVMGPTPVVIAENNNGVGKSWLYVSSAQYANSGSYGLAGVIAVAIVDAVVNAGPSARARKAANEIAELMPVDTLNASLVQHFRQQLASDASQPGVQFSDIQQVQRLTTNGSTEDAVEVTLSYLLSEDSSTLRITAFASYQSQQTPFATPYQFERGIPRSERQGPAYRNTFTYYSAQLPVPTLTEELRGRLIASIEDSARNAEGALPAAGTAEFRSMTRELEKARDDTLTKDEISIFLTREWLRDDGALLRREVEQAHEFVARYLLVDLNRPVAPSLAGKDELLETTPDERTVRRIGVGVEAGSYVSSAANLEFSTYGNAVEIARVHSERANELRATSRRRR